MGLPLYVAPVESDVTRKSGHKNTTTSPPRTSIRRVDRAADRERRVGARRAAARIYGPVQRTLSTINQENPLPWIESGAAPENGSAGSEERMRSMHDSIREMARNDARRNRRMEEHMATVFGSSWHDFAPERPMEEERQETDLGWWSVDPRGRERRPRLLTPISSRFTRSPDTLGSAGLRNSEPRGPDLVAQEAVSTRIRLAQLARTGYVRRRNQTTHRSTGVVDGLGDRERSLSPEGWDTLLTTLAPDPQPPSANTSFASGTGTQNTSHTAVQPATGSSRVPDGFDDSPLDSGCEHSDLDAADFEEPRHFILRHHRSEQQQQQQLRAPTTQIGEQGNPNQRRVRMRRTSRSGRENNEAPNGPERQALNGVPMPDVNNQDSWVGRALSGASEAENTDTTRNATVPPGEEDWSGMQHIMRSLARREDIPEEWWAQAGLSRTLSRQGTN